MPYEVRVCGAAPGLVTGGDGLVVPRRRRPRRARVGRHRLRPRLPVPGPRRPAAGRRRRADRRPRPGRAARRHLDRRLRARRHGPARRQARHDALALHAGARGQASARRRSTRTCCSSTRAACSPRPAPPPASTCACTSCARDLGVAASNHAARRLVAAPYRSGGQAQYVPRSVPEPLGERFAATREWALHRLAEPLTLEALARQARVSPRTFSRRFVEDTGYTPMQWVMRARIDLARELLERSRARASSRSPPTSGSAPARTCACTSSASSAPRRASTGAPSRRARAATRRAG